MIMQIEQNFVFEDIVSINQYARNNSLITIVGEYHINKPCRSRPIYTFQDLHYLLGHPVIIAEYIDIRNDKNKQYNVDYAQPNVYRSNNLRYIYDDSNKYEKKLLNHRTKLFNTSIIDKIYSDDIDLNLLIDVYLKTRNSIDTLHEYVFEKYPEYYDMLSRFIKDYIHFLKKINEDVFRKNITADHTRRFLSFIEDFDVLIHLFILITQNKDVIVVVGENHTENINNWLMFYKFHKFNDSKNNYNSKTNCYKINKLYTRV